MSTQTPSRPADFGAIQLPRRLGLAGWQFQLARRIELIPPADQATGRWSAAVADDLSFRLDQILAVVGTEHPIGATRSAQRLADRTGLDVVGDDVQELAGSGVLVAIDEFVDDRGRRHDLYRPVDLDRIAAELLAGVVAERLAWVEASLDRPAAAAALGWRLREFDKTIVERGLNPGRLGRYTRADIDLLAGDDDLAARVDEDRLIGPDQAATRLQIRRTDFEYLLLGGAPRPGDDLVDAGGLPAAGPGAPLLHQRRRRAAEPG